MVIKNIWFSDDKYWIVEDSKYKSLYIVPATMPFSFELVGVWQIDQSMIISVYKDFDNAYIIWSYKGAVRVGSFALDRGILHWSSDVLFLIIEACPLKH